MAPCLYSAQKLSRFVNNYIYLCYKNGKSSLPKPVEMEEQAPSKTTFNQYVLQQIKTIDNVAIYYWPPQAGIAEIDFLLQLSQNVIPVEVKASENLKAKSLRSFRDNYHLSILVRTSMSDYRVDEALMNIPLYAIGLLRELIERKNS